VIISSTEASPETPVKILNEVTTTTSNKVTAETASGDKFVVIYPKVPLRNKLTDIQKVAIYDWLVQDPGRGVDTAEQWAALVLAGDAAADSETYEPSGAGWKWIASRTADLSKQNAAGKDEETKEAEEEKSNYTSLETIMLKGGAILAGAKKYHLETDEDKAYVSFRTVHICTIH